MFGFFVNMEVLKDYLFKNMKDIKYRYRLFFYIWFYMKLNSIWL